MVYNGKDFTGKEGNTVDKFEVLRHYFGHDQFRPGQEAMVDSLLAGRDALGVMPTGAGKSMCYQVPALMLEGVTLVISPLISLMADQVAALKAAGVPSAYLNSTLTPRQMDIAIERARQGMYRIIYVAPERLETASFLRFARSARIAMIAVDEAHCVSQWGQDFRPVYLRIADFVDQLPVRPVMGAFTATATARVREDIIRHLRLVNPTLITTGFDRPNLYFEVIRCTSVKQREAALLRILRGRDGQSGIVYCATRKGVETVCDQLNAEGVAAARYHAGLSDEERAQSQEDFQYDRVQVMVATNAFGMGIDKSNVRFVIHYNMPRSMEAYYQEAGRAGRDGERSDCILLYSGQDIFTAKWMIEHNPPNEELSAAEQADVRRQDMNRLNRMIDYCTKDMCLRTAILRYFGEKTGEDCGNCSFCSGGRYPAVETARVQPGRKKEEVRAPRKIDAPKDGLMEQLKAVRMTLAKAQRVPPYIICNDATLASMARIRPQTKQGMLSVSGMGEIKTAKYADAFLKVIKAYTLQEKRMRSQVAAIAREAQSAAYRPKPAKSAPAPAVRVREPARNVPAVPLQAPLENDDSEISDAYLSGMSIQQIADELGVSPGEIRQRLADMDLIF